MGYTVVCHCYCYCSVPVWPCYNKSVMHTCKAEHNVSISTKNSGLLITWQLHFRKNLLWDHLQKFFVWGQLKCGLHFPFSANILDIWPQCKSKWKDQMFIKTGNTSKQIATWFIFFDDLEKTCRKRVSTRNEQEWVALPKSGNLCNKHISVTG